MTNAPVKQQVIALLNEASAKLLEAHATAQKANPMIQDVPVFQAMVKHQKEIGELMQQVNKLRGL